MNLINCLDDAGARDQREATNGFLVVDHLARSALKARKFNVTEAQLWCQLIKMEKIFGSSFSGIERHQKRRRHVGDDYADAEDDDDDGDLINLVMCIFA